MTTSIRRWQIYSTVTIAVLSAVSALLGLFRRGHYPPELLPQFYVQDALLLVTGVPVLVVGLWFALRGSLRARVVWLGALAYMAYMWASVGLQVPFNQFFLGYVVLFALSLFTLVGGALTVDAEAVRRSLGGRISERVYAGFLLVIAAGLAVLWLAELVPATLSGTPPQLVEDVGPQSLASHFIDLSVVVPALAVSAVLLWRGRPWGYVLGGVGLVFGAVLAPTLTATTLAIAMEGEVSLPTVAVVFTVLPAVVAAALAVTYVRTIDDGSGGPTGRVGQPN